MNKLLMIFGVFLIGVGIIGILFLVELAVAIIIGIILESIGIVINGGNKGKKDLGVEVTEFCPNCGASIKKDINFCPYCRKKL